jgi:AbiV family abortive infection protein
VARRAIALSKEQIDHGIKACLAYAAKLGRTLKSVAAIERGLAFSLACIRVEELSKALLLSDMRSLDSETADWGRFWSDFRSHNAKWCRFGKWRFGRDDGIDNRTACELGEAYSGWSTAKNTGLYVEFDPSIGFIQPGLLPTFFETAVKMGDELEAELRRVYSRGERLT